MTTKQTSLERLASAIYMLSISQKTVMNVDEAALYTGLQPQTIRNYANAGEIPHSLTCRRVWIRRADIDEWLCSDRKHRDNDQDRRAEEYINTLRAQRKHK